MVLFASLLVLGCSQEPPVEKVASAPQKPAPIYDGTIVAVGNSLTAGLGVSEDQAYPAQLARRLQADGYTYRVVNAGISGETSSGALSRIRWVVSSLQPDIVILETGANDGLRGLDPKLLESNLDQLVAYLVEQKISVILAGMRMLPNLGPVYSQAFDEIYPRIAAKHEVIFIPFFLQAVAGRPELNQNDRLHPNPDGYAQIVNTAYPYVIKAIERHRAGGSAGGGQVDSHLRLNMIGMLPIHHPGPMPGYDPAPRSVCIHVMACDSIFQYHRTYRLHALLG